MARDIATQICKMEAGFRELFGEDLKSSLVVASIDEELSRRRSGWLEKILKDWTLGELRELRAMSGGKGK